MPLPDAVIALERLLVRRYELSRILLDTDAFDRWGQKDSPEAERIYAEGDRARVEYDDLTSRLTALSQETWARDPALVRAWAEAHVDLLERFIAAHPDASDSTSRFVANEELVAWREVAAGTRPFVDENCYYVHVDRARHAEHFGPL